MGKSWRWVEQMWRRRPLPQPKEEMSNPAEVVVAEADTINLAEVPVAITEQMNPVMMFGSMPTEEDYFWGAPNGGSEEDRYWQSLSDIAYQKDLMLSTYLEMHSHIYEAWQSNPLARAIIEMTTSFVLGKGLTLVAKNKRVQAVLMRFWNDPDNVMDERMYQVCQELALY